MGFQLTGVVGAIIEWGGKKSYPVLNGPMNLIRMPVTALLEESSELQSANWEGGPALRYRTRPLGEIEKMVEWVFMLAGDVATSSGEQWPLDVHDAISELGALESVDAHARSRVNSMDHIIGLAYAWDAIPSTRPSPGENPLRLTGDWALSQEHIDLNATIGNLIAAFGIAKVNAAAEAIQSDRMLDGAALLIDAAECAVEAARSNQHRVSEFFEIKGESHRARERARLRHAEHHAMRAQATAYYEAHEGEFKTIEAAAEYIARRIIPATPRTVVEWIRAYRRDRYARRP